MMIIQLAAWFFTFSGLKRSWGSFSSCNPCRWMLRSCKCRRIQANILGRRRRIRVKIFGTEQKIIQRRFFVFFLGKIHGSQKKCRRVHTAHLILCFSHRSPASFSQVRELYITHFLHWKRFHHVQLPTQSSQFVMPKLHGSRRGPFLRTFSCVQQPSDLISS